MNPNISMKTYYKIVEEFNGKSVNEYLNSFNLGKPKIHNLFMNKSLFLNSNLAKKEDILKTNDILVIDVEEKRDFTPDKKKLDIVYEDDYLLIVNKPKSILVYPDDKMKNGTMVNIVSYYYQNKGLEYSIKYAHRLDIDTTGLLIFAKDMLTISALSKQLETHELKRTYLCLALGHFKTKKGTIEAPIGEDRHHNQRKRISKTGKNAITHYEVIKEYKSYSLVKVNLETGRTHQIRVHMASIGHPLVGDVLYGKPSEYSTRCMLHSYRIEMVHPVTKKLLVIEKSLPFDMKKLVNDFGE